MKLDLIKKIIYSKEQNIYDGVFAKYKTLSDEFEVKFKYMTEEELEESLKEIKCREEEVNNVINPSKLDTDVIALEIYSFIMNPDNEEFLASNAQLLDCEVLKDVDLFKKVKIQNMLVSI